jgi:hypothetical protein
MDQPKSMDSELKPWFNAVAKQALRVFKVSRRVIKVKVMVLGMYEEVN